MAGKTRSKPAEMMEEVTGENGDIVTETVDYPNETAIEPLTKAADEEAPFFIYLGPTIQGVIQNATIYKGTRREVEKYLEREIKKYPRIRVLIISGNRVVEDRDNVTRPGTRLYTEYQRLARELKK